jgi:drug/metabolite transporter (DMT)-like permease
MYNSSSKLNSQGLRLAYLLAVINAVVIGVSFLFVKITLDYTSPLDSLMYRFAAAFAILVIPAAFGLVKLKYRGKPLYKLMLLATMYPLGFFMLQALGLQHATSAEGGIINAFTPVVTMVLASVFLKEATSLLQKLSTLMSVSGVVFIFIMKGSISSWDGPFICRLCSDQFDVRSLCLRAQKMNGTISKMRTK